MSKLPGIRPWRGPSNLSTGSLPDAYRENHERTFGKPAGICRECRRYPCRCESKKRGPENVRP